jgi:hypothetical protein
MMVERRGSVHSSAMTHGRSKSLGGSLPFSGIGGGVPMSPGVSGSGGSPYMGVEIEWADIQAR